MQLKSCVVELVKAIISHYFGKCIALIKLAIDNTSCPLTCSGVIRLLLREKDETNDTNFVTLHLLVFFVCFFKIKTEGLAV